VRGDRVAGGEGVGAVVERLDGSAASERSVAGAVLVVGQQFVDLLTVGAFPRPDRSVTTWTSPKTLLAVRGGGLTGVYNRVVRVNYSDGALVLRLSKIAPLPSDSVFEPPDINIMSSDVRLIGSATDQRFVHVTESGEVSK
jgi:hypothetical protein